MTDRKQGSCGPHGVSRHRPLFRPHRLWAVRYRRSRRAGIIAAGHRSAKPGEHSDPIFAGEIVL